MRPIPSSMRDQEVFEPLGPPVRVAYARPPIDERKLEAAEFEMYDASHEAPDAVYDHCTDEWVHRDHAGQRAAYQAYQAAAGGCLRKGEIGQVDDRMFSPTIGVDLGAAKGDESAVAVYDGSLVKHFFLAENDMLREMVGVPEYAHGATAKAAAHAARKLRIEAAERAANPPQVTSPELAAALEAAQRAMLAHFFDGAGRAQAEENRGQTATGMMLLQEQAGRSLRGAESVLREQWNNGELRRKLGLGQVS